MKLFLLSAVLLGTLFCHCQSDSVAVDHKDVAVASESAVADQHFLTRTKRASGGRWTTQQIIECIFCIFIPPVAVLIHGGHEWVLHLIINVVLWVLGWIPGTIHAFWYCFFR
ncbi:hypothetical protein GPALN_013283 [Globodera pallida]|uniref:G_PROTEIN_RECEP_F1_2 domain-containing protein n=1 Tax=Globodera pallida TaxID=36090 RepID=A0A183CJ44_GLOPA|nr:hypothetical protein GPALN_013283 [Globodera pallida]